MREEIAQWVASKLPRSIVYFSTIRLFAHATTGKWSSQIVSDLTVLEALNRWEHDCPDCVKRLKEMDKEEG